MNRTAGRRLLAAAAAAGLMGAAAAADPAPAGRSWLDKLTGGEPAAKPAEPDGTFGGTPHKPALFAPLDPGVQAEAVRAEQDAWQRRMDVCLKLQQAAAAKGDEALMSRAAELEAQATALYAARVARLGVKESGVGR
jgi:hypothetical protein